VTQKILIVDDEPHIRLLLERTLEDLEDRGVELFVAANGKQALDLVDAERPDLVLLDVMMPLVDGFEVCRSIKGRPELRRTYVILLTAKGQELDRATGVDVGADSYLTKPFDPDAILGRAAQVLGIDLG
jgi:DNA-binding response OmpR family regulator